MIDLFATSLITVALSFFAQVLDPMAEGTDAMLQSWYHIQGYAFPSLAMIQQILNKLRNSVGAELTHIALLLRQRPWYPDVLELLVEPPVPLLLRKDLLKQLCFHRYHLNSRMLALHAWRVSRGLHKQLVFQQGCKTASKV